MTHIAFIGLGNMGGPMALNLAKAGEKLTVFDIVAENIAPLTLAGATAAASAVEAVRDADIVITMLPGDAQVRAVWLGDGGLLAHAKKGALMVDCSTISPDCARETAAAAKEKGLPMLDAPVSGGTAGAAAGTLTFIVGGADADFDRIKPVLEKMGKNIFHAGGHGAGQVVKMCNNMLLAIHMIGTAEAINLATACGLDAKTVSDIMVKSSGRNWSLELYNPAPGVMENVPASRGYSGGFGTDLMIKDLGIAHDAAEKAGAKTPLGTLARVLYTQHSANGNGKLDFSSIMQLIVGK